MNQQQTVLIHTGAAAAEAAAALAQPSLSGAIVIALLLVVAGCSLSLVGVHMLFGAGWTFVAAGALLLGVALRIFSGVKHGQ